MSKVALLTLPSGTIAQLSTYELEDPARDFREDRLEEPEVIGSRAEVDHVLGLIARLWPLREKPLHRLDETSAQGQGHTVEALCDLLWQSRTEGVYLPDGYVVKVVWNEKRGRVEFQHIPSLSNAGNTRSAAGEEFKTVEALRALVQSEERSCLE